MLVHLKKPPWLWKSLNCIQGWKISSICSTSYKSVSEFKTKLIYFLKQTEEPFQEKAFVHLSSSQKSAIFFLIVGDENKAFLICTLRKSHFCGAPASRMKYSRVNLEYHHTLYCRVLSLISTFLKLLNCKVRLHTRQWKLSPPSLVWDYQGFDPGLKFWSLCDISRVIMQKWNIWSHHHHLGIFEIFEIFARPPDHLGIEEQAGYWQSCRQWRSPQKRSRSLTHNERPCWWGRTYSSSEVFLFCLLK